MKLVTFNVNSLKAIKQYYKDIHKLTFNEFLSQVLEADIICFQETKINSQDKLDQDFLYLPDYESHFAFHKKYHKIGYSGTATFVRKALPIKAFQVETSFTGVYEKCTQGPLSHYADLSQKFKDEELCEIDCEGRVVITDHCLFILFNVYFPNDGLDENRLVFKMKFYRALQLRAEGFVKQGRNVIIAGDFNATYHPVDHCDYAREFSIMEQSTSSDLNGNINAVLKRHLDTFYDHPPRQWMRNMLAQCEGQISWIDSYRHFNPVEKEIYTCWNTKLGSRKSNYGSRIDYILMDRNFIQTYPTIVTDCSVRRDILGSDHCPVQIELDLGMVVDLKERLAAFESMSMKIPRKVQASQARISDFFQKRSVPKDNYYDESISPEKQCNLADENVSAKQFKLDDFFMKQQSEIPSLQNQIDNADKSRWKDLLAAKNPVCKGHNEPCKLFRVSKKGPNKGRYFFTCNRPPGHKDDTQYKCDHFEWATS